MQVWPTFDAKSLIICFAFSENRSVKALGKGEKQVRKQINRQLRRARLDGSVLILRCFLPQNWTQQSLLPTNNLSLPPTTSSCRRQPLFGPDNLCLPPTTLALHQQPRLATNNIGLPPTISAERHCKALSPAVSRELIYSRYITLTSSPSSNKNVRGSTKPKSVGRFGALSPFFHPTLRRSKTLS